MSATTATDAVGSFSTVARLPLPDHKIEWTAPLVFGTADGLPPPDRPPPEAVRLDSILVRNVAIGSAAALFLVILVSALAIRHFVRLSMRRAELARLRWRVGEEELRKAADTEYRSSHSFMSYVSVHRGDIDDTLDGFPHLVMLKDTPGMTTDEVYLVATEIDAARHQQVGLCRVV